MESVPRIAPLVYYSLWVALSRYDSALYRELGRRYRVTVEAVEHTKAIAALSEIPVRTLVEDLLVSPDYPEIVHFAGVVALGELGGRKRPRSTPGRGADRLGRALRMLKKLLPAVALEVEQIGSGRVFRCRRSPFVVNGCGKPTCGFISGFVTAALDRGGHPGLKAEESLCASRQTDLSYCLFELQ